MGVCGTVNDSNKKAIKANVKGENGETEVKEFELNLVKNDVKEEIPLYNHNLNLFPRISFYVNCDCNINEKLYDNLKNEITEAIGSKDFLIYEINKGSAINKIALLGELGKKGIKASQKGNSSEEINSIIKKLETTEFVCFGDNRPSYAKYDIPDYTKNENRTKLVKFLKNAKNEDILQSVSFVNDEEFEDILNTTIDDVTDIAVRQEINMKKYILNNLEEFNVKIESVLQKAKIESVFEFSVSGISLIDKDKTKYLSCKKKCSNVIDKYLFHGTCADAASKITLSNFYKANDTWFGPGVYMTDKLDYAGYYAFEPEKTNSKFQNSDRIRNIDETFTIVASQVFYDETKFEKCYATTKDCIQENGIRYVLVRANCCPLSEDEINNHKYNGFIGTEFVIPSENQILPLYSITLKRNEYYCLWKNYHFVHNTSFSENDIHLKNMVEHLLGYNMYGVGEFEEALKIIKRKKYNKLIMISNVGPNVDEVKNFITNIRDILGFDVIILFYTTESHLNWIKDFKNSLFTTRESDVREYLFKFNTTGINNLKSTIENFYNVKFNNFNADFSYPLYKKAMDDGTFSILSDIE